MSIEKKINYKAHSDDEGIDRIEIVAVPRYKTSGLSGDEWRVSASVRFYRKGILVHEDGRNRMKDAAGHLLYLFDNLPWTEGVPSLWGLTEKECHQFGCDQPAEVIVRLKDEFSDRGDGPLPKQDWSDTRRAFCARHAQRGDCGREDSDKNYERLSGEPKPQADDDSPSGTVFV